MKVFFLFSLLFLNSCNVAKKEEIVAKINGEEILLSELSQMTKQEIFDLLNLAYDIKRQALDNLIDRKLLDTEAKKRNIKEINFIDNYIKWRIGANEDSVVHLYGLDNNQLQYGRNRVSLIKNDGVTEALIRRNKLRSIFVRELIDSLKRTADIEKYIYPPKQPECIIKDLCVHYRGNLESPVQLIVASDFNCKKCVDFEKTLKRIFNEYHQKVKFGYVSFADTPTLAAIACEAAAKQNKFWEFHDAIFEHNGLVDSTFVFNLANEMKLDSASFRKDLLSNEIYKNTDETIDKLMKRGLFATPTIIINDRLIYMTNSYEELIRLLDMELENI